MERKKTTTRDRTTWEGNTQKASVKNKETPRADQDVRKEKTTASPGGVRPKWGESENEVARRKKGPLAEELLLQFVIRNAC